MTEHEARTGDKTMHGESEKCGCGRPGEYEMLDGGYACNKYLRCAERPALVGGEDVRLVLAEMREEARELEGAADDAASLLMGWHGRIVAALSLPAAQDGWVMVPREPTPEMLIAVGMMDGHDVDDPDSDAHHIAWWKDMIAATPNAIRGDKGAEAVAPWPDFAGNPIRDKDRIRHPDGTTGTVLYLPALGERGEAWRVVYEHGSICRLSLQIGDKGHAVVIAPTQAAAKDTP